MTRTISNLSNLAGLALAVLPLAVVIAAVNYGVVGAAGL